MTGDRPAVYISCTRRWMGAGWCAEGGEAITKPTEGGAQLRPSRRTHISRKGDFP